MKSSFLILHLAFLHLSLLLGINIFSPCVCAVFLWLFLCIPLCLLIWLCVIFYACIRMPSLFFLGVSLLWSLSVPSSVHVFEKKKNTSLCLHVYLDEWILCSLFLCLFQYIPLLYDFVLFLIVFLSFILHMAFSIFVFQFSTYVFFYDYKHWSFAVMLCLSTRISWSILLGKHVKDYEQQFIKAIQVG